MGGWGRAEARLKQATVVQMEVQGVLESSSEDPGWDCGHVGCGGGRGANHRS